jgi:hypothetical protein
MPFAKSSKNLSFYQVYRLAFNCTETSPTSPPIGGFCLDTVTEIKFTAGKD